MLDIPKIKSDIAQIMEQAARLNAAVPTPGRESTWYSALMMASAFATGAVAGKLLAG